jgi:hypothetical protein
MKVYITKKTLSRVASRKFAAGYRGSMLGKFGKAMDQ